MRFITLIFLLMSTIHEASASEIVTTLQWRARVEKNVVAPEWTEDQKNFASTLNVACMTYVRLGGVQNFKKRLIEVMQLTAYSVDDYWTAPGCEPQFLGGTNTTLSHLAADNPTDRLAYLIALKKFYLNERKRPDIWNQIIKAQDTRGNTILDYVELIKSQKIYMEEEIPGVEKFIEFICENGGDYAVFPKSCK